MKIKIFLLALILSATTLPASAQQGPADNITFAFTETDDDPQELKLTDSIDTFFEIGQYFHKNYPDNFIDTDLKPDIARFFPNATTQQLYNRENWIRKGVKIFRWGKQKIAEIKSKFLVPDTPVLTYKDSEYENPSDYTYEDAGENNVRITTDIKKVISYSHDPKEIETYQAHQKRLEDTAAFEKKYPSLARLKRVYDKIEFKKLPFYGTVYPDPKTDGEGISPWVKQAHASVRLASDQSRLENRPQLRGIIHFALQQDWYLLAYAHLQYPEITIDFAKSQNLKNCRLFRPLPHRLPFADGDLIVYYNNFAYPFICDVIDLNQPAQLNTQVTYTVCNTDKQCQTSNTPLSLQIETGNGFSTTLQNFITQTFTHLPDTREDDIHIQDVSIEENPNSPTGETLRLVVDNKSDWQKPEIFVHNKQNTLFSSPRMAIDGKRATIRFDILSPDHHLIDQDIEITIRPDNLLAYRFSKPIVSSSIFNIHSRTLTLGLILLAVLGGFILNFMPCVFPVLSLKILSLTKFGAKNHCTQKMSFLLSTLGIWVSFAVLATILCVLKILGHNLGWGMQFQNPLFIITMTFLILLFLAQLNGYIHLNIFPSGLISKQKSSVIDAFFSGILIVIMATPCTGPYLGTTIGFALSGTPLDMVAILMAVALGLSLPYLLLLLIPNLSAFIPAPGPWMHKLEKIMKLMLVLTIIWLLSILKAQSSWTTIAGTIVTGYLFYLLLQIYNNSLSEADSLTVKNPLTRKKSRLLLHCFYIFLLACCFTGALIIGKIGFAHHRTVVEKQTTNSLDFTQIGKDVDDGWNVLIKIGADWCLTCGYNDLMVFNNYSSQLLYNQYKVKIVNIDWTEYDADVLDFMSEYGRRGLPFYILYNRNIPEGLVLPEILNQMQLKKILENSGIRAEYNFTEE